MSERTTEPEAPPLSPEEITAIYRTYKNYRERRLLATIAERDQEIAALQVNQRTCICTDAELCAHHYQKFVAPLESKLREAEERADAMRQARDILDAKEHEGTDMKHDLKGNCVSADAIARYEDVCPYHDEPRGECSECPECPACTAQTGEEREPK